MINSLQSYILKNLLKEDSRYIVDTGAGKVYYRKADGEIKELRPYDGDRAGPCRVALRINKKEYVIQRSHLVYIMHYGLFDPSAEIRHADKDVLNDKYWNLKEHKKKEPYDPKKTFRSDITEAIQKMYRAGISQKEIAERLLIDPAKVHRAIKNLINKKPSRKFKARTWMARLE